MLKIDEVVTVKEDGKPDKIRMQFHYGRTLGFVEINAEILKLGAAVYLRALLNEWEQAVNEAIQIESERAINDEVAP